MTRYISLLKGINVGGHKKILMKDLKSLFEALGFTCVATYIQSGNVVFESEKTTLETEKLISLKINETYAFEVAVIVIPKLEYISIIKNNPLAKEDLAINQLHISFLKKRPLDEKTIKLKNTDFGNTEYHLTDQCIYIKCLGKYSDSKLNNGKIEKTLKVNATTRNWKTSLKILEFLNS